MTTPGVDALGDDAHDRPLREGWLEIRSAPARAQGPARDADGAGSGTELGFRTPRLPRVAESNAATIISPIEA